MLVTKQQKLAIINLMQQAQSKFFVDYCTSASNIAQAYINNVDACANVKVMLDFLEHNSTAQLVDDIIMLSAEQQYSALFNYLKNNALVDELTAQLLRQAQQI